MAVETRNLDGLSRIVKDLIRAGKNTQPLALQIGAALQRQTVTRFVREVDPDERAWIPSKRAQREGGQTLTDTGRLRGSILFDTTRTTATVFTNVEYGAYHQTGAGRLPVRSFIGLSARDESEILQIASDYLEKAVR